VECCDDSASRGFEYFNDFVELVTLPNLATGAGVAILAAGSGTMLELHNSRCQRGVDGHRMMWNAASPTATVFGGEAWRLK